MKSRKGLRDELNQAEQFLLENDPVLARIISRVGPCAIGTRDNYFEALVKSVIGQQLSVKVAAGIYEKLVASLGFDLSPEKILLLREEELKAAGVSKQKGAYLKSIAEAFLNNKELFENLKNLPDEEVLRELTKIKGIGLWTAQIFLIFSLNRLDVLPLGDAGFRRSVALHYQIEKPTDTCISGLAENWGGYSSVAVWYLWKGLDSQ